MTKKDITPTNPDEIVKIDEGDDAPAERKTMSGNYRRKTMTHAW